MRYIKYVLLTLLILASCTDNYNYGGYEIENDTEMGQNLILTYSDTTSFHMWDDGSLTKQEGVFFNYHSSWNIDTLFVWKGSILIESDIWDIKSDSNYITVDQKPLDLIFGKIESKDFNPHRPRWPGNAIEAKIMLKESTLHKYWIIIKKTKDIYGGYDKNEFESYCHNLKIPQHLFFKD